MKLAAALSERADIQRRISELAGRLRQNAKVQQGEQPSEQPQELMKELDGLLARLEELVARIKLRISVMRGFLDEASSKVDRYSRAEILIQSTVDVSALQKQLDVYSRELRQTDEKLQELNWTTELL